MAWNHLFIRWRIVPSQQTSNPILKQFSGRTFHFKAKRHIKTTGEVSRIFWCAQSKVQAVGFHKYLLTIANGDYKLFVDTHHTFIDIFIVPCQQTTNPILKQFSGSIFYFNAKRHIKTIGEVTNLLMWPKVRFKRLVSTNTS